MNECVFIWMNECVFIYRTYHIVSQGGLQFYLNLNVKEHLSFCPGELSDIMQTGYQAKWLVTIEVLTYQRAYLFITKIMLS